MGRRHKGSTSVTAKVDAAGGALRATAVGGSPPANRESGLHDFNSMEMEFFKRAEELYASQFDTWADLDPKRAS